LASSSLSSTADDDDDDDEEDAEERVEMNGGRPTAAMEPRGRKPIGERSWWLGKK
jgi:hypothetical protein